MRVVINTNIFDHITSQQWKDLHFVLTIASFRNRHMLYLDGLVPDGVDVNLDDYDAQILRQSSIAAINGCTAADCEISELGSQTDVDKVFTIWESCLYLNEPFRLILENDNNDSKFIDALIDCFHRTKLSQAKDYGWMEYDNAGGCSNVQNKIQSLLCQKHRRRKFLNCFVILDSDKFAPDHINPNTLPNVAFLTKERIPFHIWEKRTMENYIPDEALPDSDWKKAYSHLSERQKDYYNMASGFQKDEKFRLSHECIPITVVGRERLEDCQKKLFADVSDANYKILYTGMPLVKFKDNFPKLFDNRDNVNYDTLMGRTSHQNNPWELRNLLNEIEQNL